MIPHYDTQKINWTADNNAHQNQVTSKQTKTAAPLLAKFGGKMDAACLLLAVEPYIVLLQNAAAWFAEGWPGIKCKFQPDQLLKTREVVRCCVYQAHTHQHNKLRTKSHSLPQRH